MAAPKRKKAARLGGLKTSEDRAHMREIGRRGGLKTAARPGHIARMTEASIAARRHKKEFPPAPPKPKKPKPPKYVESLEPPAELGG